MENASTPILASDEKSLREGNSAGRSSVMMLGGYFYGQAHSETHVPTPQGVEVMIGDNGIRGPFNKASEAMSNADGRVSNAVLDGAADKAWTNAVRIHGPDSEIARHYAPTVLSENDMKALEAAVDAPKSERATVAGLATDRGVDPLASFRALAANGSIAKDDIRQLAAAYTHPDEKQRLPLPASSKSVQDVRLDRKDAVTLAAIRKLEAGGMKNRAAEAYEDFGMALAKKEGGAAAMPFLMTSCSLAREHTRERGRDVRSVRKSNDAYAR